MNSGLIRVFITYRINPLIIRRLIYTEKYIFLLWRLKLLIDGWNEAVTVYNVYNECEMMYEISIVISVAVIFMCVPKTKFSKHEQCIVAQTVERIWSLIAASNEEHCLGARDPHSTSEWTYVPSQPITRLFCGEGSRCSLASFHKAPSSRQNAGGPSLQTKCFSIAPSGIGEAVFLFTGWRIVGFVPKFFAQDISMGCAKIK